MSALTGVVAPVVNCSPGCDYSGGNMVGPSLELIAIIFGALVTVELAILIALGLWGVWAARRELSRLNDIARPYQEPDDGVSNSG